MSVNEIRSEDSLSVRWLIGGLILGLLAALYSVLLPEQWQTNNMQVVAEVNGTLITREKYLNHLQALASDKKDAITADDAEYVLQRIIEEELLVQRGLEVGLIDSDKRTRSAMVNAMIGMTTASAEATPPSESDLTDFFNEHIDYFTPTSRIHVSVINLTGDDAGKHAEQAVKRLRKGEDFTVVRQALGSPVALSVPENLLPPTKLREYLGPSLVQTLQHQSVGYISAAMPYGNGFRIIKLVDKEVGQAPAMVTVREQVEAEYVRRLGDQTLREYLAWLKDRADIQYPSELPL
ncbi:peptidylprolyl isomerase [Maricurvus nonylphenolicus]|uniref:peptidylprolyl isomerase n=1 Tax=Maricurvus nonylphenolicus TaxID=1008307 RepID=UPI0036F36A2D